MPRKGVYDILWKVRWVMSNYYIECIEEIDELMSSGSYEAAANKIREELSMPYIPMDFEEKLHAYEKELLMHEAQKKLGDDEIDAYFEMDEAHQLLAVKALRESNMRQYLDLIQKGLDHAKSNLVTISLIEACIDQQLNEEFHVVKDGLDISFIPSACVNPCDSEGVEEGIEIMRSWLENENPSLLQLCIQCIYKEAYLHLPFEIEEEESEDCAYEIVMYVSAMMGCENEMKKLLSEKNASQKGSFELLLYSNTI